MTSKKEEIAQKKDEAEKLLKEKADEIAEQQDKKKADEDLESRRYEQRRKWANWMEDLRNSHYLPPGERGEHQKTQWDKVDRLVEEIINSEQTTITDWRSNMMSLWNFYGKMGKAITISANQVAGEVLYQVKKHTHDIPVLQAITHPQEFPWEWVKSGILRKITDDNEGVNIGAFKHKVTHEDGKVKLAPLTQSDGIALNNKDKANEAFKKFVDIWLLENEYVPKGTDGTYVHVASGARLDVDTFNALKDHPKNGLGKFLEDSSAFKFEEQQEKDKDTGSSPSPS